MVLDYSERKPVSKNRARKQPVGIFVIILISAVSMSFSLGLLSGWMLFKQPRRGGKGQAQVAMDGTKNESAALSQSPPMQNPDAAAPKSADPPLTFYETLPKGGKAVIGSGLNPKKNEDHLAPKPVMLVAPPSQQTAAQPPAVPGAVVKPDEHKEQAPAAEQPKKPLAAEQPKKPLAAEQPKKPLAAEQPKKAPAVVPASVRKQDDPNAKYCVQIASSQDRKDADAIKAKMAEKGLPVYVVESKIKDKGTWYRVRAGRHLTQQAAGEMAAKAGKGALVIPE
jgi:cell division protein FtsN